MPNNEQRTAAGVAGALYLIIAIISLTSEFLLRGPLLVSGDAVRTAQNIVASEQLFRMSIVSMLLTIVGNLTLLFALYVILEHSNRHFALLAAFFRLAGCAIFAITAWSDFIVLRLLSGADYLLAFDTRQVQALARMFISARHDGGLIGGVFWGLGSAVFAWLWLKSRYIPRGIAIWGIVASLALAIGILVIMVFPGLSSVVGPAYWAPIFLFEVTLGFWLLVKGLRAPMEQS